MTIHQEITIAATPSQIYDLLTNAGAFEKATGAPASIEAAPGGAFSCFNDQITGRIIDMEENDWLVQAWRVGAWPAGVYSLVKFTMTPDGKGAKVTLDQAGHPEDAAAHLEGGWAKMYWEPFKAHFG